MIRIEGLKKTYGPFTLDCSMAVKKGRITGLIGQNGAGKSTTFKAILGLIAFEGSVRVLDRDVRSLTVQERQALGVVLSDSGFSGYLTVKDIVPVLKNLYAQFDEADFAEKVRRFGLPEDKPIKAFSTGMKAKLKVLAAISHGAKLLILDEPTAGLDVIARDELLCMLREYMEQDEERAILISSHISSDLETLCDEVYMIHDGRIVLHEDTDVLLSDYAVIKVDAAQYEAMDKRYILAKKREAYGYSCLTNQRAYYMENNPQITVERGTIDSVITMMIKGEKR